jgi:hypothetical protein
VSASAARFAPAKPPAAKQAVPKDVALAYGKAMERGRSLTRSKKFDEAIAAFDDALKALPGSARAISERGYAKLLAGKLEDARRDLRLAEASTKDSKLLAQIHYNHGLVAEKLGKPEEAKAAFARSNALRPTQAAASKVGLATCVAVVETQNLKAAVAKDHLAMFKMLEANAQDHTTVASNEEAKTGLTARIAPEHREMVISYPSGGDGAGGAWNLHPWVKTPAGMLFATGAVATHFDMPCGGDLTATSRTNDGLQLVMVSHASGMRIPLCESDAGELVDCGDNDIPATSACGESAPEVTYVVFDLAKKSVAATVSFTDDGKAPKVRLDARKLLVEGAGCSIGLPL